MIDFLYYLVGSPVLAFKVVVFIIVVRRIRGHTVGDSKGAVDVAV